MCGRFTLHLSELSELRVELGVEEILISDWAPRYNIAPSQTTPVVITHGGTRERRSLQPLRWGLIPRWAKDPSIGTRLINARVESVADKPSFRDSFARRRCLVPSNGFFEWRTVASQARKQPIWVHPADDSVMVFAGLWDEWISSDGEVTRSFSIVTTEARGSLLEIHDRMPLGLRGDDRARWLAPSPLASDELSALVERAGCVDDLVTVEVSTAVNSASYDAPDCIERTTNATPPSRQLELFD